MYNDKFYMKVVNHHNIVQNKIKDEGDVVLMTVAIGSQNYGSDTPESDCDTFSFTLPNFLSFIRGDVPKSYEFEVEDGKCCVKDLRHFFNLLRKTSPNSIECLLGQYKIFNPKYKDIILSYLTNENLFYLTHADYLHMINASVGMAAQIDNRNMPIEKKIIHAIRLEELLNNYLIKEYNPKCYLELDNLAKGFISLMRQGFFENFDSFGFYQESVNRLRKQKNLFELRMQNDSFKNEIKKIEETAKVVINGMELELIEEYLKEHGFKRSLT